MSNTLLERPTEDASNQAHEDAAVIAGLETQLATESDVQIPAGVLALRELGIESPLPPQAVNAEQAEKAERRRSEGISGRTIDDMHTILSDDFSDVGKREAARKRLEKGTITERALAFATDVTRGIRYDMRNKAIAGRDTRSTLGYRSRDMAIADEGNSFAKGIEKMSIYAFRNRKLSSNTYSAVHSLGSTLEQVQEKKYPTLYTSDMVTNSAVHLIVRLAPKLDKEIVFKLLEDVPDRQITGVIEQEDYDTIKALGELIRPGEPSAPDAHLFGRLFSAHDSIQGELNSERLQQQRKPEDEQKLLVRQKQLQDTLAELNQTRGYTPNELRVVDEKPNMSIEDFETLHALRHKVYYWERASSLPDLRKYIVENPKALEMVNAETGDNRVYMELNNLIYRAGIGIGELDASARSPEDLQKSEQVWDKLIELTTNIPDEQQRIDVLRDLTRTPDFAENRAETDEEKNKRFNDRTEMLDFVLTNAPELATMGNCMVIASQLGIVLDSKRITDEFGSVTPESKIKHVKEALLLLEGIPKDGRAFEYFADMERRNRSALMSAVLSGYGSEAVSALQAFGDATPKWMDQAIFEELASNSINHSHEVKPLYEAFVHLQKSEELSPPAQKLLTELIATTSLERGFAKIRFLCEPENHQSLEMLSQLGLRAYDLNMGIINLPHTMDTLKPITEQLSKHPVMRLLASGEVSGQKYMLEGLLNADEPLKYADALMQSVKMFGDLTSAKLTDTLYAVYQGGDALAQQDPELLKLVGEGGQPGIDKLSAHMMKFRDQVLRDEIDMESLEHSPLYLTYFKALTRYEQSQWGSHYDNQLLLQIKFQAENSERGRFNLIDEEAYKPSELLSIAELDKDKIKNFEITKDGMTQWEEIVADLRVGLEVATRKPERLQEIIDDLSTKVDAHVERLEVGRLKMSQKLEDMPDGKKTKLQEKLTELETEIEELRAIDEGALMDVTLFLKNVSVLGKYKDTHRSIRKVLFTTMLMKSPQELERVNNIVDLEEDRKEFLENGETEADSPKWWKHEPDLQDIQELADLVQHVTNQETWGEAFKNFGLYKSLDNILNVNAINENINRGLNVGNSGTRTMEFRPTRGLLMELSGHMADACWASRYESIAEQFPNFTSVSMVQKPGTKDARFIGAGFLIEAKDVKGEPILVIRGLNPIQNVIEQVDPKDFFEKFSEYARGIAEKRGMKLAVVIDDHSGGSTTNRPALFEYLSKQIKPNSKQVVLGHEPVTTFNNYQITQDTYLL